MRVIDQAFPSDGGSGFLKINPHHDMKVFRESLHEGLEPRSVFKRRGRIMNRARTDHHKEAVILAPQNCFCSHTGIVNQIRRFVCVGQVIGQDRRGDQGVDTPDAQVVCSLRRHGRNVVARMP